MGRRHSSHPRCTHRQQLHDRYDDEHTTTKHDFAKKGLSPLVCRALLGGLGMLSTFMPLSVVSLTWSSYGLTLTMVSSLRPDRRQYRRVTSEKLVRAPSSEDEDTRFLFCVSDPCCLTRQLTADIIDTGGVS